MDEHGSEERGALDRSQSAPTGLPRWVKVFLIVAAALALLAVGAALVIGGEHGPGRHQAHSVTDTTPMSTRGPYTEGSIH